MQCNEILCWHFAEETIDFLYNKSPSEQTGLGVGGCSPPGRSTNIIYTFAQNWSGNRRKRQYFYFRCFKLAEVAPAIDAFLSNFIGSILVSSLLIAIFSQESQSPAILACKQLPLPWQLYDIRANQTGKVSAWNAHQQNTKRHREFRQIKLKIWPPILRRLLAIRSMKIRLTKMR